MDKEPKKVFFTQGDRKFIRFSGKQKMLIEVFSYSSTTLMEMDITTKEQELSARGLPFYGTATSWDGVFHLLVAIEFPEGVPASATQKKADNTARIMRKLADWYRYTVLNAQAN
jgi:hypothetical protein